MKKHSAGILVYKIINDQLVVLLGHPGGPYFTKKDNGSWTIPKGEYDEAEEPFMAAKREFQEETGQRLPSGDYVYLGEFTRSDGKNIKAWAVQGDINTSEVISNSFDMEWPPQSGRQQTYPEIDKADWFSLDEAVFKLSTGQNIFLVRLAEYLRLKSPEIPK